MRDAWEFMDTINFAYIYIAVYYIQKDFGISS